MFVRVPALFMSVALAVCASAASVDVRHYGSGQGSTQPGDSCNSSTGTQQCCNSVAQPSDPAVSGLLGLLGIVLGPVDALVGLTCTPIVGAAQCNSQPVCCSGNNFGGLISIGCTPINIGL